MRKVMPKTYSQTRPWFSLVAAALPSSSLIAFAAVILTFKLTSAAERVDGSVVISYENWIEILHPKTGNVSAKFETKLNCISNLVITALRTKGQAPENSHNYSLALAELLDGASTKLHHFVLPADSDRERGFLTVKNSPLTSLSENLNQIDSMAYDFSTDFLFVLDSSDRRIFRYPMAVPPHSSLPFSFPSNNEVKGLAVDSCRGHLYWTLWHQDQALIERSDVDGGNRVIVVHGLRYKPRNVILENRFIYWIGKLIDASGYVFERMHVDTLEREALCQHSNGGKGRKLSVYSLAVDHGQNSIYLTDWHNSAIWKLDFGELQNSSDPLPRCNLSMLRNLKTIRPLGISVLKSERNFAKEKLTCETMKTTMEQTTALPTSAMIISTFATSNDSSSLDVFERVCSNYCLNHDIEEADFFYEDGNFPTLTATCSLDLHGIPWCRCQTGFGGSRCQLDPCHNFCLNGGLCQRGASSGEALLKCKCRPGFQGERCELREGNVPEVGAITLDGAEEASRFYFGLFITAATFASIFLIAGIVGCFEAVRLRKKLLVFTAAKDHYRRPAVVKKSSEGPRVFATSRPTRTSKKSQSADLDKGDFCNSMDDPNCCTNDGVVLDLEDCCRMTICDTPCVEAIFRSSVHGGPRSRRLSVSKTGTGSGQYFEPTFDSDTKALIPNDIPTC